jgi:putative ABC transport system permease protein
MLVSLGAATVSFVIITAVTAAAAFSARADASLMARTGAGVRATRQRTRAALVSAQVAVALVLLAGATLFVRSLQAGLSLNPGVGMDRVLVSEVSLTASYDAARATAFFDELLARVRAHPAVESMAYSVDQGGMGPRGKLAVDGQPRAFPSIVRFTAVDPNYFRTVGISVKSGRDFTAIDALSGPRVAIVSEAFARLLSEGGSAVGRRITMPARGKGRPPDVALIVGVVPDVVSDIGVLEPLAMYLPLGQQPTATYRSVTIRARATDSDAVRRAVSSITRDLDAGVVLRPFPTLRETLERQMGPQRLGSAVLGVLGAIALLLTVLGTYVLADSMATLRMREMGIRAALGATSHHLGALILTETARLVGTGLAVGLALAWLGASTLRAFLFQVEPLDPPTLAGVAAVILGAALVVALRPTLKVARLNVARVLRQD